MQAALVTSLTGPDGIKLSQLPNPTPAPDEVLVKTAFVALNFLDTLISRGRYQFKPALPFAPAGELSGTIMELGSAVRGLVVGDRVCAYTGWGAAAELVAVKAAHIIKVPDGVGLDVASSISVTYGTALHGLKDRGELKSGETVAVLGASGGAGLAAVEIAKALGARVIACASSPEKLDICRARGADALIDYSNVDLKFALREATQGQGPDVIYDCVGGAYAEPALRSIAWMGRFLVVGFAGGEIPKIPLNLLLLKSCDLRGVFWGEAATRNPAGHRANMGEILTWIASGRLAPHIHATLPLSHIADGIRMLDERSVTGKVVIKVGS